MRGSQSDLRNYLGLNRVHDGVRDGIHLLEDLPVRNTYKLARLVIHAKHERAAACVGEGDDGSRIALGTR